MKWDKDNKNIFDVRYEQFCTINEIEEQRDLTMSYDKSPYTHRRLQKAK